MCFACCLPCAVLLPSLFILLCFPASSAVLIFAGHVLFRGADTTPAASLCREPRSTRCFDSLSGLGRGQTIAACFACCQGFCCPNFCRPCSLRWGSVGWGDIIPRPPVENSEPQRFPQSVSPGKGSEYSRMLRLLPGALLFCCLPCSFFFVSPIFICFSQPSSSEQ